MPRTPRTLSIRLFKRGGWWHLDIRQRGKRWREATDQQRQGDAQRIADRRRAELGAEADHAADPEAYSVEEAVADWRESPMDDVSDGMRSMLRSKAGHALRLLGDRDLTQLRAADVTGYVEARRGEGAKDHTVAKELVTLRRLCSWAEEHGRLLPGWRGWFPVKFRTGYDPRDRWLEESEYAALLRVLPAHRRLWVQVAVFTGARESEIRRLDWSDVDFRQGFVTLRSAKTRKGDPRKPRHIPMAGELRAALIREQREGGALRVAGPVVESPWRNPVLMLTRAAAAANCLAGLKTLCNNDLRRTFASWMLQRGATEREVADLLGHGSTAMVSRVYGHLAKRNLVEAVRRLPRFGRRRHKKGTAGR